MIFLLFASLFIFPYGFYSILKIKLKISILQKTSVFSKLLFLSTLFVFFCWIQFLGFKINFYIFFDLKYRFNENGVYEIYRDYTSILLSFIFILIGLYGYFLKFNNINPIHPEIEKINSPRTNVIVFNVICFFIHFVSLLMFYSFLE
jgi:hypothetical protein